MSEPAFAFGRFELFPDRRLLMCAGQSVPLGSRAVDLPVALVKRAGQVVRKDELRAAAWPDTVVEDGNFRVHIAALRKALSEDPAVPKPITNVAGRGSCFVAKLADRPTAPTAPPETPHPAAKRALPPLADRVIGCSASVEAITGDNERHRLVTVTGPGGIGKTTVALQVAATVAPRFADHVVFVDLSAVSEDGPVASALAAASAVAAGDDVSGAIVNECVRNLVTKSLVAADVRPATVRFRLLATSRAFAREQFVDRGETDRAARQHARYYRALFERAEAEWETRQTAS